MRFIAIRASLTPGSSSVSTEAVGDAQETMKAADKVAEAAATGGTNAN